MKKVLIAIVFLLVLFIVAVEVNKRLREGVLPEERERRELLVLPHIQVYKNDLIIKTLPDGTTYLRGVVKEESDGKLVLELQDRTIDLFIDSDTLFEIAYTQSEQTQQIQKQDFFERLTTNDVVFAFFHIDGSGRYLGEKIMIIRAEG